MFCNQCGTKLDDGAAFCVQCGAKMDVVDTPVAEEVVAEEVVAVATEEVAVEEAVAAPVESTTSTLPIPQAPSTLPTPTQAAPTQVAPTQAAPTQAAPTQAAPTQAAPTQAAPVQAAPAQAAPVLVQVDTTQPMTIMGWIGTMLLMMLPIVNIVMFFIFIFGANVNKSKKTYFIACLILGVIGIILGIVFAAALGTIFAILIEEAGSMELYL